MASGLDEEDTRMDAVVNNVHAVDLVLRVEVSIESLLNVVDDGAPRLVVVDEVTEPGGIDDCQAKTNAGLLNVGADGLDGNGLGNDVEARSLALLGGVQGGVEECVYESRLAQARLACCICVRKGVLLGARSDVPTTITLKLKPLRTLLRCHWFGRLAKPT